jgi:hypothetical protein
VVRYMSSDKQKALQVRKLTKREREKINALYEAYAFSKKTKDSRVRVTVRVRRHHRGHWRPGPRGSA